MRGVALKALGGLCLVVGCAQPSPAPQPALRSPVAAANSAAATNPAAARSAVGLQVVLRGPAGVATRALAHREKLPTGARVALHLTVRGARPLWLYAYHRGADGALEPLQAQPARVAPGELYERPEAGLWYRLEGSGGRETFYVIAAAEPLGAGLEGVLARLPDEREPPPLSSTSNRFPGPMYQQDLDEHGVATAVFTLLHAPE